MIDALIAGKLHGAPSQKTSKNGNTFTTAKVRVPTGEDSTFCNVIAFDEGAQAALLALGPGEAVALSGSLRVGTWTARDGTARPSLDMTASQVLTSYHVTRKRKAMQRDQDDAGRRAPLRQPAAHDDLDDGADLPI